MKKVTTIFVVTLMAILATSAFAGPTIEIFNSWGNNGGGEFLGLPGDFGFTAKSLGEVPGMFETFCLEQSESISYGVQYDATLGTAAVQGSVGGSDPLSDRTAYLYEQFITGSLAGYHYSVATPADQLQRRDSANALQSAIWYLEDEISSLPAGLATTFYNLSAAGIGQGLGTVLVINPYYVLGQDDKVQQAQSLLVSMSVVPAPGAILLGSIGVGLVGWLRRKRSL